MAHLTLPARHHPDCYPSRPKETLAFFQKAFAANSDGPLPNQPQNTQLKGVITPHIDFRVSLPAYATAFQPLLETPLADTYIILGVGHHSPLEWNLDHRDYLTPLGQASCATDLVDRLTQGLPPRRLFAPSAHEAEHSIEFPLLWLQALHELHPSGENRPFRFVPILCGGLHRYLEAEVEWDNLTDLHHLAAALGEIFHQDKSTQRVRVIVSIDGCHLGPRFQHPFRVTPALLKATAGWEEKLWSRAEQGDARAFLDWMREEGNDRYFDGVGALALLLAAGRGHLRSQRTAYEQWFTEQDASAVTFSSGRILAPSPAE